uniref:CBS domain-containing protein n=1 Tax=Oryza nivara TaxID=4536 RepID=A0A0E0GN22_ORYNI
MAQAIAHRVTQVWVVDADDGELVGVVRFLDVLSALADELATNEEGSKIDGEHKPPVPTNFAKFVGRSVTSGLDDACMTRVNSGWWPGKIRRLEGPWLFSFAGAARRGSAKSIHSELIAGVGGGAATVDVLGFGSGCGGGSAVWGAGERPRSRTCVAPHSSMPRSGPSSASPLWRPPAPAPAAVAALRSSSSALPRRPPPQPPDGLDRQEEKIREKERRRKGER